MVVFFVVFCAQSCRSNLGRWILCVWSLRWFWVTGPFVVNRLNEKEWTKQENDGVMKTFCYMGFPLCLTVAADTDSAFPVRASLVTSRSASGKNKKCHTFIIWKELADDLKKWVMRTKDLRVLVNKEDKKKINI